MIELHRKTDWQVRFNDYLAKAQTRKFKMGSWDCCIFIANGVKAMTGIDGMSEFRGKYSNKPTSDTALKKYGQRTLYHTLISKLGKPVAGVQGKRGDIAYDQGRLGFIIGREALFLTDGGYHRQPITQVKYAFRIPF